MARRARHSSLDQGNQGSRSLKQEVVMPPQSGNREEQTPSPTQLTFSDYTLWQSAQGALTATIKMILPVSM